MAKLLHAGGQGFQNRKGELCANLRPIRRFLPHGLGGLEPGSRAQRLVRNDVSQAM